MAASRPARCTRLRPARAGAHQARERLQALGDRRVLDRGRDDVRRGARAARAPGQRRARQRPVVRLGAARRENDLAGVRRAHERRDGAARVLQRALALRRAAQRACGGASGRGAGRVRCSPWHEVLSASEPRRTSLPRALVPPARPQQFSALGQASLHRRAPCGRRRAGWRGCQSTRSGRAPWPGRPVAERARQLGYHVPVRTLCHLARAWRAVSDLRKYWRRAVVVHVNCAADVRQRGAQARRGRRRRRLLTHLAAQRCATLLMAAQPERGGPATLYACYVCEAGAPGTDADCMLFFKPGE